MYLKGRSESYVGPYQRFNQGKKFRNPFSTFFGPEVTSEGREYPSVSVFLLRFLANLKGHLSTPP